MSLPICDGQRVNFVLTYESPSDRRSTLNIVTMSEKNDLSIPRGNIHTSPSTGTLPQLTEHGLAKHGFRGFV